MKNILEIIEETLGEEFEGKVFTNDEMADIIRCTTPEEDEKYRNDIVSVLDGKALEYKDFMRAISYVYSRMILLELGYDLKRFDL